MKIVYGTPYIEVEFGQRDEGWLLSNDVDQHIERIKNASSRGSYGDGYYGPIRPLFYYEIPLDCVPMKGVAFLKMEDHFHTHNKWNPRFKGKKVLI